ncbi:tartrate dehydrogenase/decarboxylase / D-malate dehydrogenase [Lentibacillus persicus]|uniref:D-malate dehydrogenase (decarboxylating) n=1 Tax=Lentibacillus persicus TaxID=640948 RepID=A0A1I2ANW5_9BACI|nr:tartrate dehydrogenase [Lentibacillus persicus]SFE44570.1 tartrate dehydrogenase/decarboxylase / D-malate dehydrogenase [Lentibacillus persicus]
MASKIAIIPGDGIGPEVMKQALKVLEALKSDYTLDVDYDVFDWSSDYYLKHGRMLPEDGLEKLKNYDAILFGAIGDSRVPDDVTVWELIMPIRKTFEQYVNFRPVKQLKGITSPLADSHSGEIDFVILRENSEGEYSNSGGLMFHGQEKEMAIQNSIFTKAGIKNIAEFAFEYARKHHYSKVTSATKSNAITHTMKFWDKEVGKIAESHRDIDYEKVYVDALAAKFVQQPEEFQVVLASNLFGDILSDLGSAVAGGLGISPSANINPSGEYPSMFEPVHGSAPDIAGQGRANPIAQVWSLALLLEHIGRNDLHDHILKAIEKLLLDKTQVTNDIGGSASTEEAGDALVKILRESKVELT